MRLHWPEYAMEAAGLGLFMISASLFGALFEYPSSPVRMAVENPLLRRAFMGIAMGGTAIAIIHSPWGKQSGAHINPAVTLTFWRLKKVAGPDALGYALSQFLGASSGVLAATLLLGDVISDRSVNYVATQPGGGGPAVAFFAEAVISFVLMMTVLAISNTARLARFTGVFAGCLVALYITFEAPLSGMSMNPARSFGSAVNGGIWNAFWVYVTAPLLGMLAAAEVYVRLRGLRGVHCAKLHHHNDKRCIFRCRYGEMAAGG